MTAWDHEQYLKFGEERTRAARELLARVPLSEASNVVDLGCGPGNSTRLLLDRFPTATVVGVDNSAAMLARARADVPKVTFIEASVAEYRGEAPADLLFANAVLHWLPEHESLLPALLNQLRPGGVLALQVPRNFDEPSHRAMRELTADDSTTTLRWRERLASVDALTRVAAPERYYDWLASHAAHVDIWQTNYQHVMANELEIVEWVKGTGLRPYLDALPSDERALYLERYASAIAEAYPPRADGRRLFNFPRLFVVATRA